ncbi:MAG: HAMP domain-containing histidine kinase, partial [Planctomycetes bacterium]|nr:HAMP domain-containing histidine kinase [Planctomycetota bacterium]
VAHEINNPLDGVQNCARILRRSLDEPKRSRQMLDLIDGGLGRIELIVRRLLTLAREHVIRPTNASIFEIVASAKATVGERLTARRISVTITSDGQPDRASVDPLLLEHVYVNLFLNAADSMPDGGAIDVRIRRVASAGNDDRIRIEVEDSGAGVDPKLLPHIFEPFVTTKSDGKGTGLGLAIAARIVDAHHGTITVKSTVGLGTLFAVEIPALAPPDAPAVPNRDGVTAAVSGERGY